MKQTGLFRSITKTWANCEQSGKAGADGAQGQTMPPVTYIPLGGRRWGRAAQRGRGLHILSFQVPAGTLCATRGAVQSWPLCAGTLREVMAKPRRGLLPKRCSTLRKLQDL